MAAAKLVNGCVPICISGCQARETKHFLNDARQLPARHL
ncbi:hypothetical protein CHK_1727 [Christensenella hongkongensis]|uniref:Uncharacterized protein n=1 Tax=Christensenella hongkongensis TaxID=270498 RepID=A0A0M2NIK2_9FIRM|nr:hypothetical protein CHK_1727 [Christensenella hongkongensis]